MRNNLGFYLCAASGAMCGAVLMWLVGYAWLHMIILGAIWGIAALCIAAIIGAHER